MSHSIQLPLTQQVVDGLNAGDEVRLTGTVLTGRDRACARLFQMIQEGQELPVDLRDQIMYFVGPSPAPPGKVIGAAGPTTSGRMNPFLPSLLASGLKGFIGKGHVSEEVKSEMLRHKAIYFGAIGGTGALLSSTVQEVQVIAFEELMSEAVRRMSIVNFPAVVLCDIHGGDLYKHGG